MPTLQVRDIQMYYEEDGPRSASVPAEPIVLLHGFGGSSQGMKRFVPPLAERYRVLAVDWRGHGRTTNPGNRQILHSELGKDLAGFCDAAGLKRAHFIGISSGGMQLFPLVLARPEMVQTMTLTIATHAFEEQARQAVAEIAANQRKKLAEDAMEEAERTRRIRMSHQWEGSVWATGDHAYTPAQLRTITRPALIVHGDRDVFFPVRIALTMYESMPNAELCVLPRCGHEVPERFFDHYVRIVLDFLGRNPIGGDADK